MKGGEIVLVIGRAPPRETAVETVQDALKIALRTMSVKDALAFVSHDLNVARRTVYQMALDLGVGLTAQGQAVGIMPFDFCSFGIRRKKSRRAARGLASFHAGQAAEAAVARHYSRLGHDLIAQRWRGTGGELDLVVRDGDGVIFVEVKHAARHEGAADRVSPATA